ncbi:hypothetical protein B0H10DRAFT_2427682 [Mycena sp. CBHHK59/15]|nr:hypothetical protein B0H10DRAFT_2427682 [Mycena sp. CBHHK59/15]
MTRTPIHTASSRRRTAHPAHSARRRPARDSDTLSPRTRRSSALFRDVRSPMHISDDDDEPGPEDAQEAPSYAWDNEATLVSALLQDGHGAAADPDAKLTALADSLHTPFAAAGRGLLTDIAHTLQPAVQRVTAAHRATRAADASFATGLLAFDDACKRLEAVSLGAHDALHTAFAASEARIKELFRRLEVAYLHRDRLWADLGAALADTVDPALAALTDVPAHTERTIAALERHAKTLASKDKDSSEDKIKGLLARFAV